jgi:hypothetical protein
MSDETPNLSDAALAVLAARPQRLLSGDARARLWERIDASAGASAAASANAGASAAGAGASAAKATGIAAGAKALAIGAVFAAGVGAGVAGDRWLSPAPAAPPPIIIATPQPQPPAEVGTALPVEPTHLASPPPAAERPKPASSRPPSSSANERSERLVLEAARTALLKRDASAALEAIARHRATFPKGALTEERDALEVQALASLGRTDEARSKGRVFLKNYPQSVFGPAVEASFDPLK